MDAPVTAEAEAFVRALVDEWLAPEAGECLGCYLDRSVTAFGCAGDLRFAGRYRDLAAPRATALERRLAASGGFCDCEVLMNAMEPAVHLWASPPQRVPLDAAAFAGDGLDEAGLDAGSLEDDWYDDRYDEAPELEPPLVMPPCTGVRRGSTQPCSNWLLLLPRPRWRRAPRWR